MKLSLIRVLLVLAFPVLFGQNLYSTHLMGGNLFYEYLGDTDNDGDFNYKIIIRTYINCGSQYWGGAFPEPSLTAGIYEGPAVPVGSIPQIMSFDLLLTDSNKIELGLPDTCSVGSSVCIYEVVYEREVDLPLTFDGYHIFYSRCCRNPDIINIFDPGTQGMSFEAYIPPSLVINNSPVFADLPVPFICVGDTQSIINTAFDIDGDQLIFSLVHPFNSITPSLPNSLIWPIDTVTYESGYSKNVPFGTGGYAFINGATGYSEYLSPDTGKFVVAVEIKEFRNNQLIGITRRDMQLQIIDCPYNPAPKLSNISGSGQTIYSIDEGDSLCFPITFTDELGDSLSMTISSPIFDTSLTNPAASAQSPISGDSIVSSNFCWKTACGQGQGIPYLFTVSVSDKGCPPKTADAVYEITVVPFIGPTTITGVTNVCPYETGVPYTVPAINGATYTWVITKGTQVSGGNTNSIVVDWDSTGVGIVQVTTTSYLGCSVDPITLNVSINAYPVTNAGSDIFICSDDTGQLGTGSSLNYLYSWNPTQGLSDSTISNPTITLTNLTGIRDTLYYVVTSTNNLTSCKYSDTVRIIIYPIPTANAGLDISFCSGDTINLGSPPLLGFIYYWNPDFGLNDSTLSNPTITLNNFGIAPDTFLYIVTATDTAPNCFAKDTVQVIVNPYPIPNAGPDISFCSGLGDTIGDVSTNGYIYQWTPSTGLNDSLASNPEISLINTDTIIDTIIYIVSTSIFNCTAYDSLQVLVYPLPLVDAGPNLYFCSGDSAIIGTAGIGTYSYLWSPSLGLTDTNIAKPQVSLSNSQIPNDTTIYLLTVTTVFGCQDSDSVNVVVNHLPVSEAGNDTAFCSGETVSIGTNNIIGFAYSWLPTTGVSNPLISDPTLSLVNTDTIIDTIMYTVTTTLDSCSSIDSVMIIVYPSPIVDAGPDKYLCSGDNDTIGTSGYNGYSYQWTPYTGLSDSSIAKPGLSLINPLIANDTIVYSINVTTGYGCIDSDSVEIIVNHLPISEAGNDLVLCSGETDSVGTSNITGYTYLWSPSTGLSDSNISKPSIYLINTDTIADTLMYYISSTVDSCNSTDSVIIIVLPLPFINAGSDTGYCSGDTASLGFVPRPNYTYSWTPVYGLSDSTISNPSVSTINLDSIIDTTYYFVRVEDTITFCVTTDTVRVLTFPIPKTSEIVGSVSICPGADSVEYIVNESLGSNYLWNLYGSGNIITGQGNDSILVNWDTTTTWTITVMETDSNTCISDTSFINGTTNITLEPPAPIGLDTICGDSINGIIYSTPFTNGSIYNWFISGGSINSGNGSNSVNIDWDSVGTSYIWFEETSTTIDTVCTGFSDSLKVEVFTAPTGSNISGDFALCQTYIPSPYLVTGLTGSIFTWFITGDTISNGIGQDSVSIVWDSAGSFILRVLETASGNCTNEVSDTVLVYPKPITDSIVGETAICFDSTDSYLYHINGFPGSTYYWFVDGGTITSLPLNNDSIMVSWDSALSGTVSVIETSLDTCVGDTVRKSVYIYPVPQDTSIDGGKVFCEDTSTHFYSVNGLPGSYFTWLLDGDTIDLGFDKDSISLIWDSQGTYVITLIEVTINLCSDTLQSTIIVNPKPSITSVFGDTVICLDTSETHLYYVNGFAMSTFNWTIENGNIVSAPLENDSILVIWDSVGTGELTVVETSKDSCIGDTLNLLIELNEIPYADSIEGIFELCQYSNDLSYSIIGSNSSTYLWSFPGASNIIDDSSSTITLDWDSSNTFYVNVIEISDKGCAGDTVDTFIVVNPFPETTLLSGDTIICPPNNINQEYSVSGSDSSTFTWSVTGGVIISGQGTDSIFVDWDSTGAGSVMVVEVSKDSCFGNTIGWMDIQLDSPEILLKVVSDGEFEDSDIEIKWDLLKYSGYPDSVSIFERIHFTQNPWNLKTIVEAGSQFHIDQSMLTDQYSFEYQILGLNACLDTISSKVHNTVLLNGSADESAKTIDLQWNKYLNWENGLDRYEIWRKLDDEITYTFNTDAGADTAIELNSGLDGFKHCFRILAYENGGNVEISWSNELCVEFEHLLIIPTVISPNGNGLNDTWKIKNIEFYPEVLVEIYNRWGMPVFSSKGYPENWNGTFHGKELPVGVYYYVINLYKDNIKPYTGSVSILHRKE